MDDINRIAFQWLLKRQIKILQWGAGFFRLWTYLVRTVLSKYKLYLEPAVLVKHTGGESVTEITVQRPSLQSINRLIVMDLPALESSIQLYTCDPTGSGSGFRVITLAYKLSKTIAN
jgi:hypothetical protein